MYRPFFSRTFLVSASLSALGLATTARGSGADAPPTADGSSTNSPAQLPEVIVTGQKEAANVQSLPVSDTAVTRSTLQDADIQSVKEASHYAPNAFVSEFTSRADSAPVFRGITGANYLIPGVTTLFDGVPQLHAYSSSIELIDVDQVEFVRGPQGGLYGRNTAGGLVNVTSVRPSEVWTGQGQFSYGNYNFTDFRGSVSGPVVNGLSMSLAGGYSTRDGYNVNNLNGKGIDNREAGFGKGQLLYKVSDRFELRLILSGETDHDGDYAIEDYGYILAHPNHVARNLPDNGFNHRDLGSGTLLANYYGEAVDFASISAGGWWRNNALTDWDYYGPTALGYGPAYPAVTASNYPFYESNIEKQYQISQEFRASSSKEHPIKLSDQVDLAWQSGLFFFDQNYQENQAFPGPTLTTENLDVWGVGLYGQGKATAWERLDVTAGLRYDFEHQHGDLFSNSGGPRSLAAGQDFSEVSPQASLGYHLDHDNLVYFSVARGYRAGGFNNVPASLKQTYGTEHDWNYELGYKSRWLDGRVETKLALFYIDWSSLQLNQFIPLASGAYYTPVINANSATSKGVELEAKYRPVAGWDLFGSLGYTDATFGNGNSVYGVKVDGNPLPNTPSFTGQAGTQVSWAPCKAATLYARAEVDVTGNFQYGPTKSLGQETFALANFRAGLRGKNWFAEGWVNNAFDTHYIPIAFHLGASAQSGWAGESGLPLTFGLRAGLKF